MRKILITIVYICLTGTTVFAQKKRLFDETPAQKQQRMQWWEDARFGMFIHWGLYALPARHEWVKNRERITNEQYQKYFDLFNPDLFEPKKWAKEAKAAGMKYAVLTTKHHEGFCLFDSKYTDYKATNTPAKRDLVKEFVEAFRAEGIKVGFYYSLIDWHHPDFTIDRVHPQRLDENAPESEWEKINKGRDMAKYREYLFNQVTELLTNYGKIDILWLDFSYPGKHGKGKDDWNSVALIKQIRKLQPGIIVDNRLNLGDYEDGEDFETPEQVKPETLAKYRGKTWETCQTFSGSWGYYRDEHSWKSDKQLLDLLITSTANGGNLILNVGPTARGEFDYRATRALDSLSLWMHGNSRSIYNCTYAPDGFSVPEGARLTYNPQTKRLYVHLFDYPYARQLVLKGYGGKISYAQLLHDGSEVRTVDKSAIDKAAAGSDIVLELPAEKPPVEVPVIELILK
jgi:alpha-L-fucosidase